MYERIKDNGREKFAGATVTTWPLLNTEVHKSESAEDAKKEDEEKEDNNKNNNELRNN